MTYGERLKHAMTLAAARGILSGGSRSWTKQLADQIVDLGGSITVQSINAALRDEFQFKPDKLIYVCRCLQIRSEWLTHESGEPLDATAETRIGRDKVTTGKGSLPYFGGRSADVNHMQGGASSGPICLLPLLTNDRLDLMRHPNSYPEVEGLPKKEIPGGLDAADLEIDKVVEVPFDVPGTDVKQGYMAVFRPLPPGKRVRATDLPIVIKSASGSYHLVSYNSLATAAGPVEVVAVCYHVYKTRNAEALWE